MTEPTKHVVFTLNRNWGDMTPEERQRFIDEFADAQFGPDEPDDNSPEP